VRAPGSARLWHAGACTRAVFRDAVPGPPTLRDSFGLPPTMAPPTPSTGRAVPGNRRCADTARCRRLARRHQLSLLPTGSPFEYDTVRFLYVRRTLLRMMPCAGGIGR
jgi:ABC-type transporter lipoprotein component MlaA